MIYFAQPLDGGPIKIGYSVDVPTRVKSLERHYGKPLTILATIDGDLDTERRLHERFQHLRLGRVATKGVRPEQFRPGPELMTFIGRPLLVHPDPSAVEAMEPRMPVRIDRAIAAKAKIVASDRGIDLATYVSEVLRATVDRDWSKIVKRIDSSEEDIKS